MTRSRAAIKIPLSLATLSQACSRHSWLSIPRTSRWFRRPLLQSSECGESSNPCKSE